MIVRQLLSRRGALSLKCRSPWQRTRPTSSIPSSFDGMVPPFWVERLRSRGFAAPTEIQAVALPLIMPTTGSDGDAVPGQSAVLQAETGTGKTLCYLLPMLEHLRQQLAANALPGADPRVTPSGLVIVPTRELAAQVHAIASSLMPEAARFMRIISGSAALGASQEVGIIISTPVALETNVHFRHLLFVRSVVLDEADMLLSGAFRAAVQGYVLARFKQRMPEDRPQQLFCGATVPCSGTKSVAAFLDKYYAPPAVLRISTPGCHRALPRIAHTFIQIDAAVPLTQLERASQELLQRRAIDELRAQEILAEVEVDAAAETSEETALTGDEGAEVTEAAPRDAVAHEMRRRALEDNAADLRADHADYMSRVVGLRLHVLLEALLLPSRIAAGEQAAAGAVSIAPATPPPPTESSPSVSSADGAPSRGSRAARRRSRVDILGLSNGMPVARGRAPADASAEGDARKDRARDPKAGDAQAAPESAPPSALSLEDIAKPLIVPLATPTALRTGLTADECALVPATLVFVNSSTSAASMRKSLKAAAPELHVEAAHSRMDDDERARLLQRFADGSVRVLVCTDILARGIDTLEAAHVIQAEFATDATSHLHRVGRTGRAGRSGRVTSLVTRASLGLAQRLAASAADQTPIDTAFSRNRSLSRSAKKQALVRAISAVAASVAPASRASKA